MYKTVCVLFYVGVKVGLLFQVKKVRVYWGVWEQTGAVIVGLITGS